MRSTNGGATWEGYQGTVGVDSVYAFASNGSVVYAAGNIGSFVSFDSGSTWMEGPSGLPPDFEIQFLAIGDRYAFASTVDMRIWRVPLTKFEGVNETLAPSSYLSINHNFPNPIASHTTISFALPNSGEARLAIVDALGRETQLLHSAFMTAGEHTATWDASEYPPGVYLCRLESGGRGVTRKLLVMR